MTAGHQQSEQNKTMLSESLHSASMLHMPLLLVILVTVTIFAAESAVMLLLALWASNNAWIQAILDGLLLILFLTPSLYYFAYRPMRDQIAALLQAQNQLQAEITERKLAEDALRRSEGYLKFFASQLLSNQEKERRWISRELHEELAQDLAALNYRLRIIDQMSGKDQDLLKEQCEENLGLIRKIIGDLRKITGGLAPIEIGHGGLTVALRERANNLARDCGIAVSHQIIELDDLIPSEARTIIYRIILEAIANAEKHAHATHLSVIAEQQNELICITVEDNGIGFNTEDILRKTPSERGLGLAAMQERAEMLGGALSIWSHVGEGTKIIFMIPETKE
jgi:signal transduction histidine kinase